MIFCVYHGTKFNGWIIFTQFLSIIPSRCEKNSHRCHLSFHSEDWIKKSCNQDLNFL